MTVKIDKSIWGVGFEKHSTLSYFDFVETIKRLQFICWKLRKKVRGERHSM